MIIFHHNDADGRCGAAVVYYAIKSSGIAKEPTLVEMDYKNPVPFDIIKPDEVIVLVDFSFKEADMSKVLDITRAVTWIDHHVSAKNYFYNDLPGLRDFTEKGKCGAELAWMYYHPTIGVPEALTLLGDYDSWRMQHRPKCLQFYEGLKLRDTSPKSELWPLIWADYVGGAEGTIAGITIDEICKEGNAAIKYRDSYCTEMRNYFGYDCTMDGAGKLNCYALNCYKFGSQAYGEYINRYDVLIGYISDGHKTTVSLYSANPDVDVSVLAKYHGGGGHKGAAGFVVDNSCELPFKRI